MTPTLSIVGAFLFMLANGFVVATEFAVGASGTTQMAELEAAGKAGAGSLVPAEPGRGG